MEKKTTLIVNGQEIPLNEFVNGFFASTILGMIASLRGVPEPRTVEIRVEVSDTKAG